MSITIHVVGFDFGDWTTRVPANYDLSLDVREFIGRGNQHHGHKSALHDKNLRDELAQKKGVQDCLVYLQNKITKINKTNIVLIIGCAKGRHRSVTIAMELQQQLKSKYKINIKYHYCK